MAQLTRCAHTAVINRCACTSRRTFTGHSGDISPVIEYVQTTLVMPFVGTCKMYNVTILNFKLYVEDVVSQF